ncbi:unnamed protein product [Amoebophrya sp. A120]|nr:unnamed protein product [Amoebophrya sp. A120]|eukprot:GSA120T00023923001.1
MLRHRSQPPVLGGNEMGNLTGLAQRATVKAVMFFWVLTAPALQLVLPTGGASASARASASSTTASSPKNLPSTPPAHPGGPALRVPQLAGGTARGVSGKMKKTSAAAVSAMAEQDQAAPAVDDFPELSGVTRDGTTSNTSKSKPKRKRKRNKGAAQQGANAQGPVPVDPAPACSGCAQNKLLEVVPDTGSCKSPGDSCGDKDSTLEQSTQHSPDIFAEKSSAVEGRRHRVKEEIGHQPEDHDQRFQAEFQGMTSVVDGGGAPASTKQDNSVTVEDGGSSAASAPPTAPLDHKRPAQLLEDHEEALQLPDVDHEINMCRLQTPESNTWGHHPGLKNYFPNLQFLFQHNFAFLQDPSRQAHDLGVGAEHAASRADAAGCSGAAQASSTSPEQARQPPGTVNLTALLEAEAEQQQQQQQEWASQEDGAPAPAPPAWVHDRPGFTFQQEADSRREQPAQGAVAPNPSSSTLEETQSQNAFSAVSTLLQSKNLEVERLQRQLEAKDQQLTEAFAWIQELQAKNDELQKTRTALRTQNDELHKTRTVLRTMLEQAECRAAQAQNAMTVRAHEARLAMFQKYKMETWKKQMKNASSAAARPAGPENEQQTQASASATENAEASLANASTSATGAVKKPASNGKAAPTAVAPAEDEMKTQRPTLPTRAGAGPAVPLYGARSKRGRRKVASSGEAASGTSAGGASSAETPEAAAGATVEASGADAGSTSTAAAARPPLQLGTTTGSLWRADQRPSKIETKRRDRNQLHHAGSAIDVEKGKAEAANEKKPASSTRTRDRGALSLSPREVTTKGKDGTGSTTATSVLSGRGSGLLRRNSASFNLPGDRTSEFLSVGNSVVVGDPAPAAAYFNQFTSQFSPPMGPSTCTAAPVAFYLPPGAPPNIDQQQFQQQAPSRTGTPDLLTAPTYQGPFIAGQPYPTYPCVQHPQHNHNLQQQVNVGIGPTSGGAVIPPFQVEQLPSRPGSPGQIEFDNRMGMQHHAGGSSSYMHVPVVRLPPAMSSGAGGVYTTNSNSPPNQPMDLSTSGIAVEPLVPGLQHQHLIAPVPLRGVVDPTDSMQMVHQEGGVHGTKSSASCQHAVGGPSPSSGGSTTPARTTPSPDFALAGATAGSPTTVSQHQSPHAHWGTSSSSTNNKKSTLTQPPTPPPMHPAPTFLPSTSAGPPSGGTGRIDQYQTSEEPHLSPYEATRRSKQVPLLLDVLLREKSGNADEAAATEAEIEAQQSKIFAAVGMPQLQPPGGSSGRIDHEHLLSDID